MLSRPFILIATLTALFVTLCGAPQAPADVVLGRMPEWKSAGNAVEIDYLHGDLLLKDLGRMYVVIAGGAEVQFPAGRRGCIDSLREGCYVRVLGERLSERTLYARTLIVLDEAGRFQDMRQESWSSGGLVVGDVVLVSARDRLIRFRVDTREYAVYIGPDTVITRDSRAVDIYTITPRHRIAVAGSLSEDGAVRAERIVLADPSNSRLRADVITGSLISFSRSSLKLSTAYGLREIELSSAGTGSVLSSSDVKLEPGALVSAHGTWRDRVLVADRVQVIASPKSEEDTTK